MLLFSCSVMSDSFQLHRLQHVRLPCVLHHLLELAQTHVHWVGDANLSSVFPSSSCLQSFSASGSFLISQLFASGGQSIGALALASVLPKNIQKWFPLGLTGLISFMSKGLSKSSPTPQFKNINSMAVSFLYDPTLTSIHDYWVNHSFDYIDLCWQSNVSAF